MQTGKYKKNKNKKKAKGMTKHTRNCWNACIRIWDSLAKIWVNRYLKSTKEWEDKWAQVHCTGAETGNHKGQTDEASQRKENKMAGNAKSTKMYEGGTCKNKTASRNHGNTLTQRITKTHGGKRGNVKTRKRKHWNTKLRNKLKTTFFLKNLFIYMHFVYTLCFYCFFFCMGS